MPDSLNAVLIVALLIAPGLVALSIIRQRLKQFSQFSDIQFIVATIALGVIAQATLFAWPGRQVIEDYSDKSISHEFQLILWLVLSLIVVPAALGSSLAAIVVEFGESLKWIGLDEATRTPRAWSKAMEPKSGCFVRAWLSDGTVVGGVFADNSLAGTDQSFQDLFLEQTWEMDENDWFKRPFPNSGGIWLAPSILYRIEFILQEDCEEYQVTQAPERPQPVGLPVEKGLKPPTPVTNPPPKLEKPTTTPPEKKT